MERGNQFLNETDGFFLISLLMLKRCESSNRRFWFYDSFLLDIKIEKW